VQKKGDRISRAGKIKGNKITLLVDEEGFPVNLALAEAGRHDLYAQTTVTHCIPKGATMTADRGYDAAWFRKQLRMQKIKPLIPKRKMKQDKQVRTPSPVTYKGRWVVERCFAWFGKFRKLNIRYEYRSRLYKAFWYLGAACLLLKKLTV